MLFLKSSELSGTGIKTPKSGHKNIFNQDTQATQRYKSKNTFHVLGFFFSLKEKSPRWFTVLGLFVLFGATLQLHVLFLFYEMASVKDISDLKWEINKSDPRLGLK